jgi:hypothetical protein
MRSLFLLPLFLILEMQPGRASDPFDPARCLDFLTESFRKIDGAPTGPIKYLYTEGEVPRVSEIQTHHLKMMLGEVGNKVDLGLYRNAKSILLLADGSERRVVDRLGPFLAREFPKKTVLSADVDVGENLLIRNWGNLKIDHLKVFPVKDNSFDRIILRKGLCQCHSASCCAGFHPLGPEARQFFSEVVRVLDKGNPESFAVLHGEKNVGGVDVATWRKMLDEISKSQPIEYEMMFDGGFFHSILIRPAQH